MVQTRVAVGAITALACAACATIHSVESTSDTPLPPRVEDRVEAGSLAYEVSSSSVQGYEVRVAIQQSETCATLTTPRVHRLRHIARQVDTTTARVTWALAITALGAGAYGYYDAENLAARAMDGTTAAQFRQYSTALLSVAAIATVVGIVDGVRAGDSDLDDGEIQRPQERSTFACRQHAARNVDASLALANGHVVRARTDDRGLATFTFLEVPEDGLPTHEASVRLVVDGKDTSFTGLEPVERARLRDSLLAESRSKLAMQMLEKRRAVCQEAVGVARTSDPADDALDAWPLARSACGELWTPQLDSEQAAFGARTVVAACQRRLEVAAAAFVDDSGTTVDEMTRELAALGERCTTPESVTRLRALHTLLAASVKRAEREAAAARAQAAYRQRLDRARRDRSYPEPAWPASTSRACCKVCSAGKACGNTCIARWKTCHVGAGCACD